jgi:hypothetical protein
MKGAAAPLPQSRNRVSRFDSPSNSPPSRSSSLQQDRLQALGFEEGELEMFFEMTNVTEDQLVHRYLEIAQNQPYNLNWGTETRAINANYMLGVFKRNGVEYTKHDIVEDTLSSFYEEAEGRAQGIRKKKLATKKHRTNKKSRRAIKRKHTRRYRRKH